jgi:hypothetical protein
MGRDADNGRRGEVEGPQGPQVETVTGWQLMTVTGLQLCTVVNWQYCPGAFGDKDSGSDDWSNVAIMIP